MNYPTVEELSAFKRENAREVARSLGVEVPPAVLAEVADRRVRFNPYPEAGRVMEELREMGLGIYAVSNWDVLLEEVIEELDWMRYVDGLVVSALVGVEKPEPAIFEEALRVSGHERSRERVLHVGNDPVSDVRGASRAGIPAVLVDRAGDLDAPEAVAVLADLSGLPALLRGGE